MWIVAIAWIYVALMMALAEATNPQGTILGAVITFVFYGVAPTALVMYLLGAPTRRKARLQAEAAEREAWVAAQARQGATTAETTSAGTHPDAGSLPTGDPVSAERKEP
ncbi:hypothetical protein [Aquabacterium sp.]|uniref:hypothetical protein n=1 Tax=Aquabacterium sp. TaxID=1872578 RepID=UPI0025C18388|nr:hypothetical protein [Aquabacterium sp.]